MKQVIAIALGCAALAACGSDDSPQHDSRDAEAYVRANWEQVAEEHDIVDEAAVTLGESPRPPSHVSDVHCVDSGARYECDVTADGALGSTVEGRVVVTDDDLSGDE